MLLEGGVVDQHVEPAELLHGLRDRAVAEARVLDVAGDQQARRPSASTPRLRLLGVVVLVEVDDRHVGAFAGEQHGHGAADARVAAGDEGRHAFELAAAAVVGRHERAAQPSSALVAGLGLVLRRQSRRLAARAGLDRGPGFLLALARGVAGILAALDAARNLAPVAAAPCGDRLLSFFFVIGSGS